MEMHFFARLHAHPGDQEAVAATLRAVVGPTREEPGCLGIQVFQCNRDPRLFYVYSRWTNEAAFERHAALPRILSFVERIQPLIDHPFDSAHTSLIG